MIGIIGAMEEEIIEIKNHMQDVTIQQKAGMDFYKGKLNGKDSVVVKSGIGKVNASACTQILADIYNVDCVINSGIAGSLKNEINIGDIVISKDAIQHDMDAVSFGYPKGQIPRMDTLEFKADARLIELASECCRRVNPEISVFVGRILTGDIFVSDGAVKEQLMETFDGACTEMEGAAIAQVAYINKIPFLIIRAISDKADGSATMDYPEFEAKAIEHCVKLTLEIVANI